MAEIARLQQFYPFDEAVLERVGEAADGQNQHSFARLAKLYDITGGPEIVPADETHKAFEVLTLKPEGDYDASEARVLHLPMSLGIDYNMAMRALRLFGSDPSKQLLMVGNPASVGESNNRLRLADMRRVWSGDLTPIVDPLLAYLSQNGVSSVEDLGVSYGADKAAASSARAADHDIDAVQGVWVESTAVDRRGPGLIGLARLGIDFVSAGNVLEEYVEAADSPPLIQARADADPGMPRYILGLGRLSNIAIANSLAHAGFPERARAALKAQDELRGTLVWGTDSELTTDSTMAALGNRLKAEFGSERTGSMAMQGMHHNGVDDIDLHAAIMLQALSAPRA